MEVRRLLSAGLLACCLGLGCNRPKEEQLVHGRFGAVVAVRPGGSPESVALLLTDRDGWTPAADRIAHALARNGALVIGIPLPRFYVELEKQISGCEYTDGDLENLSHFVQAYYRLPSYVAPILVGYGEGAAFAYANLAQAPVGLFGGAVTLGFCPKLALRRPLCAGRGLVAESREQGLQLRPAVKLPAAWVAIQGGDNGSCPANSIRQFTAAVPGASALTQTALARDFTSPGWLAPLQAVYGELVAGNHIASAKPPPSLIDLPIIALPAQNIKASQPLAVLWSGDGGWAGLDAEVASALAQHGVPVVGVDSLRYFWSSRTPENVAADIDRIVAYYGYHWQRSRVLLIGYSQGADILPFALNQLPLATRLRVALVAAIGLGDHAVFEFHLSNWVSDIREGYDTLAELRRIDGTKFLCIYGDEEREPVCPTLKGAAVRVVKLPGSHHFNGDYGRLAEEILKAADVG